jgi:hypothetical protein
VGVEFGGAAGMSLYLAGFTQSFEGCSEIVLPEIQLPQSQEEVKVTLEFLLFGRNWGGLNF